MAHRALPAALLTLLSLAACASPSHDETAADNAALSGGRDLDDFVAGAKEDGDIQGVKFVPAVDTALQVGRPGNINYVVIHDIEGSGRSAVNTFRRAGNESSSHYVVDKNGVAVQMVREENIANHAFHTVFNAYAIGIEHAGFAAENGYTEAEYEESSRLVASIVTRYHIPIDRQHIVSHAQVPKTDTVVDACAETAKNCGGQGGHVDPGPSWDWTRYMALILKKAQALGYTGANAAEQAARALTPVSPMQKLTISESIFGGYYATQCDDSDPSKQTTYRTIEEGKTGRLESRYVQTTVGECGIPVNGVYPLVMHGFPTKNFVRDDLDLRDVSIEKCDGHRQNTFKFEGVIVKSNRSFGDTNDIVLTPTTDDAC